MNRKFIILDFGSQYTWLIARVFRELGYLAEVKTFDEPLVQIQKESPYGIILSGGPASVFDSNSPKRSVQELLDIAPCLGICYGMQLICSDLGGVVKRSSLGSYGYNEILWQKKLIPNVCRQKVWMSHADVIEKLPPNIELLASSSQKIPSAIKGKNILAFQFHPEVQHTENGKELLEYFAKNMCQAQNNFSQIPSPPSANRNSNPPSIRQDQTQNNVSQTPSPPSANRNSNPPSTRQDQTQNNVSQTPNSDSMNRNSNPPSTRQKQNTSFYKECELYVKNLNVKGRILCALSGGVDSTVTACLLTRIFGFQKVQCLFVDTGLLRKNEFEEVLHSYKGMNLNIKGIQAEKEFLVALKGVSEPERKRKIIGHTFIDVFKKYKDADIEWLAQGTLYPDVIESPSSNKSATIKSHHNVGGLPQNLGLKLIEPVRHLFKDEVRLLGKELNLPSELLNRHPFPGPGLAIRIIGDITKEKLDLLREVDHIFIQELKDKNIYNDIWQAFCVLLSCQSVGVQGDQRTFEKTVALRAVHSKDGMTANWYPFSSEFLKEVSNKITNQVRGVNRVTYDITSKPPGTIEWE